MKFIPSYEGFKDSLNENRMGGSFGTTAGMPKLDQAADLIASFVSKKTGKAYKKVASFTVNYDGIPAIMLVSDKDDSVIYVIGKGSHRGPGIVSALVYNGKDTFSVESENFPIVALLNEFVKLINEPSYKKEVETIQESLNEASRGALTPAQQKTVMKLLQQGKSAASIARDLKLSYGQILKLKANPPMNVSMDDSTVKKNEETLNDKVKFLDETLEDIYDVTRAIAAGAPNMNSLMISGRAGTGKTYNVTKALTDEGLVEGEILEVVHECLVKASLTVIKSKSISYIRSRNKVSSRIYRRWLSSTTFVNISQSICIRIRNCFYNFTIIICTPKWNYTIPRRSNDNSFILDRSFKSWFCIFYL